MTTPGNPNDISAEPNVSSPGRLIGKPLQRFKMNFEEWELDEEEITHSSVESDEEERKREIKPTTFGSKPSQLQLGKEKNYLGIQQTANKKSTTKPSSQGSSGSMKSARTPSSSQSPKRKNEEISGAPGTTHRQRTVFDGTKPPPKKQKVALGYGSKAKAIPTKNVQPDKKVTCKCS